MSDKTYAETQGKAPFDWNRALDSAIAEEPDHITWRQLCHRAQDWVTCAVGNQCAIIPRCKSWRGQPYDDRLSNLGLRFFDAVEDRGWRSAKILLDNIEQRSAYLIKEELAKLRSETVATEGARGASDSETK